MATLNRRPKVRGLSEAALVLGFSTLLLVLILTSVSSYRNVNQIIDNSRLVRHTHDVLHAIEESRASLTAAESFVRGYVVAGNKNLLGEFESSLETFEQAKGRLIGLTADNPEQQERLRQLDPLVKQRVEWLRYQVLVRDSQGVEAVSRLNFEEALNVRARLYGLLTEAANNERQLMGIREERTGKSIRTAAANFWIGSGLAVFLLFGFFVMVHRSIEHRKQLQKQEAQSRIELEQRVAERTEELVVLNRGLEAFSYSVSHDLRAPLRAVGVYANILEEDANERLTCDDLETVGRIKSGVSRMSSIIDGLLSLTRIARDKLIKEQVDLSELAHEAAREAGDAQERYVDLDIERGLMAMADKRLMTVLLMNLIGNAYKYTARTERPKVRVGKTGDTFYVADNGAGFDQRYAEKMFEPFQRLHTQDEFSGSGIGLATCETIVRRHGGRIWAEGEIGKGATFYFTIPSNPS